MKKLIVIALAVVLALSAFVVFAACGKEESYDGEYQYAHPYGGTTPYGAKVTVTVKNGIITNVKLWTEAETGWTRTSADNGSTWTKHDETEASYADFLASFEGLTVDEVKAISVACAENGVPSDNGITKAPESLKLLAGATQSYGRIIKAVQNALSKIEAAA